VRIPHAPGLDGLRGLAVAAVVVFHAGPPGWMPGGFLGVSLFFTLSGYLIATLVLAEVDRDQGLGLAAFWSRRVRRLVPALLVTIVGVLIAARFVDLGPDVRADMVGGLTYSANWVQVFRQQSYADLFRSPSPLTHLWSLAIEEQFYVVLPLAAWAVGRRRPERLRTVLAWGSGAVVAAGVVAARLTHDVDLAYYGTLHRAPEIAIGVLLACLTRVTVERAPAWLAAAAVAAGAVSVWAWRGAHYGDAWIAEGGLAAFAVASAVLVRAASRPGPVASALSFAPLRWLGLASYGLYLYHWPVVVLLDRPRVHWAPVPLFAARTALSLAIAAASYFLIELPLRRGRPALDRRVVLVSGVGALAVALVAVLVLAPTPAAAPERRAAPAVVDPGATVPSGPVGPPVLALFGDSLPNWLLRDGGAALDRTQVTVVDGTIEACDGAKGTPVARSRTGIDVPTPPACTGWPTQYPKALRALEGKADVAVLMVGAHAALDRRIEGEFRGPCDPVAARWYGDDLTGRLRYLATRATRVVLVLPAWEGDNSGWINPPDHRDRIDCVRRTMTGAARRAGARTLDFGAWLCPDGRDRCRDLRTTDGIHIDPAHAPEVLRWLVVSALHAR
jgi:peptidoglycan/LPS O-acetylase OafA/YrhL